MVVILLIGDLSFALTAIWITEISENLRILLQHREVEPLGKAHIVGLFQPTVVSWELQYTNMFL